MQLLMTNPGYLLFLVIWKVWNLVQDTTLWFLSKLFSVNKDTIDKPVKIFQVFFRKKLVDVQLSSPRNFLALYRGNASVNVLMGKTVSLYCLYNHHIYFVDSDQAINVYNSDTSPFVHIAQWKHALKLLAIPLKEFVVFARNLQRPQIKILLLSSTGRCGSTLLTQMMETSGSVLPVAEPDIFSGIHINHYKKSLTDECIGELLNASFRFFAFIAHQHGEYKSVVLKPRPQCMSLVPLVYKHAPWVQHLFMYRQGLKTVASMYSAFSILPWIKYCMNDREMCFSIAKENGFVLQGHVDKVYDFISMIILLYASKIAEFKDFYLKLKIPIHSISYEDLINEPREMFRTINTHYSLGLNENQINQSLWALDQNSQRGLSVGKHNFDKILRDEFYKLFTPERRQKSEEICKVFEIPNLESDEALPGSLC